MGPRLRSAPSVTLPVGMAVAVAVGMALTSLFRRQPPETPGLERRHGGPNISFQRDEDLDPSSLQAGERPLAETPTENGVHGTGTKEVQRSTRAVDVMVPAVAYGFQLPRLRVHEGEERCTSEMVGGHPLEALIIQRRYTELHSSIITFWFSPLPPITRAPPSTRARVTVVLPDFSSLWTVPLETPIRSPAPD